MGPLRQAMQQEPTTELLTQAAEPPSPGPAQPVAACSHGPSAGAVCSSNCRPDMASAAESPPVRGHNDQTSQGEPPLCPALSLPAFSCPGPGRSAAPARPFRRLPGRFHECSCVPDASVLLCADSQGHQPSRRAQRETTLSSLSSTVSRGVSPVALAVVGLYAVSRKFPGNFQLITCPAVSSCFDVTLAQTITSALLESLLESLLELMLVLMECTLQPHNLHMYYNT
jgi:hypothetical protein